MEVVLTLHSLKHNPEPHEKLQSYINLRKTHFAMRFARQQHPKSPPDPLPIVACFPVVVNNRLCSFRSERCVNFSEETEESPENRKQRSPFKKRVAREAYCLYRRERAEGSCAMFDTMKITKAGLSLKGRDTMRRTEVGFKGKHNLRRRNSLLAALEFEHSPYKRSSICGWETGLPEYCP